MFILLLLLISVFVVFGAAGIIISEPDNEKEYVFFAIMLMVFGIGLLVG